MSFTIEEDRGTYTQASRQHNGYFAGDFSRAPMATPYQLAALTHLHPAGSMMLRPDARTPRGQM